MFVPHHETYIIINILCHYDMLFLLVLRPLGNQHFTTQGIYGPAPSKAL